MFFKKLFLRKLFLWDLLSVVPASAGVILPETDPGDGRLRRSRECGGDPKTYTDSDGATQSFPRVRG